MGHTEIGVTMNVYGHLFEGAQGQLTKDLDDLLGRTRSSAQEAASRPDSGIDGDADVPGPIGTTA